MRRCSIIPMLLALSLGCRAPTEAPAPDNGLGEVLRAIVTDSLVAAGRRPDQTYIAADAESDTLLRDAGLAIPPPSNGSRPECPGSTDAADREAAGPVGYAVRVRQTEQGPDALRLEVSVWCSFSFHGRSRGFAQGTTWELRRVSGRWRTVRELGRWIT